MQTELVHFDATTHTYTRHGAARPSVTTVIGDMKLAPPYPPDDPKGKKAFGTAVHKAGELLMHDRLDLARTDPRIQPYMEGLEIKRRELGIRPIATELRVFNDHLGYAGTLDLWCTIFGAEEAIFDYKTGRPPTCVELQTAGYCTALEWMAKHGYIPGLDKSRPWKRPRRFSMELTPGRAIIRECPDDFDYHAWHAAVTLWKWKYDRRK